MTDLTQTFFSALASAQPNRHSVEAIQDAEGAIMDWFEQEKSKFLAVCRAVKKVTEISEIEADMDYLVSAISDNEPTRMKWEELVASMNGSLCK